MVHDDKINIYHSFIFCSPKELDTCKDEIIFMPLVVTK